MMLQQITFEMIQAHITLLEARPTKTVTSPLTKWSIKNKWSGKNATWLVINYNFQETWWLIHVWHIPIAFQLADWFEKGLH